MTKFSSRRFRTIIQILKGTGVAGLARLAVNETRRRIAKNPRCLLVETATKCNLNCPWCDVVLDVSSRKRAFMPLSDFRKIIRNCSGQVTAITFIRTGEPTVNPELLDMIELARRKGFIVTLNSNLATIEPEMIERLVAIQPHRIVMTFISADPKEYEAKQVGASFEQTVNTLLAIHEAKRQAGKTLPLVEVQLIATKSSVKQLEKFEELVRRVRCDAAYVKPMRVDLRRTDSRYERVHLDDVPIGHEVCNYDLDSEGRLVLKYQEGCPQEENVFVTVDGEVYPCLFSPDDAKSYGNLISDDWKAVWKGSGLAADKRGVLRRRGHPMCSACIPSREISLTVKTSD